MASKPSTSPVVTFLSRLRDNLRNHVADDAFVAAVRDARSHAGGKERARRQAEARAEEFEQQQAIFDKAKRDDDPPDEVAEGKAEGGEGKSADKTAAKPAEGGSTSSSGSGSGGGDSSGRSFQISVKAAHEFAELTKASVNYRTTDSETRRCGTCSHFSSGDCDLVIGSISPSAVCDRFSGGTTQMADPIVELEQYIMHDNYGMSPPSMSGVSLLKKDDPRVDYRDADDPKMTCGNCSFFCPGQVCCIVEGSIKPHCTCNLVNPVSMSMHEPTSPDQPCPDCGMTHAPGQKPTGRRRRTTVPVDPQSQMFAEKCPCCNSSPSNCKCKEGCPNCSCASVHHAMAERGPANFEPNLKLFIELQEFAEPPEWIPFLPTPGEYKHPKWGTVAMSRDRAQRMMKNFADKVYQGHIPIDLEHSLKVSGAAGYVNNLRQNSDGSVDAKIDWTDLGRDAISKDRFRYFSPEWWDKWNHPTNGQQFNDVIVGGALTTRPFFKDSKFGGLRPLVANERGLFVMSHGTLFEDDGDWEATLESFAEDPLRFHISRGSQLPKEGDKMGMTEEETRRFNEMFTTVGDLSSKYEASEKAREQTEASLRQANETIAAMQLEKDTRRFSELSTDWPGDKSKNVDTLLQMAKAFGEDSDLFKNHVETMNSAARHTRAAGLFSDVGTSRTEIRSFGGGILDEVNKLAEDYVRANPGMSAEAAQTKVFSEHPELYDKYEEKRQTAVRDNRGV